MESYRTPIMTTLNYFTWIILVFLLMSTNKVQLQDIGMEYCQLETFSAQCNKDEVIIMENAKYGRMRLGKCVTVNYGSLGCQADVLPEMDRKCSGRHECSFVVSELHGKQPCPNDLTPYLEASYDCLKVTVPDNSVSCIPGQAVTLRQPSGYIASVLTEDRDLGSASCPWLIQGQPGQQINVTIINFARAPNVKEEDDLLDGQQPRICYQFAEILDDGVKRTITECEGGPRISKAYLSTGHQLTITIVSRKSHDVYFLLKYEVIGCANPHVPKGAWSKRMGDSVVIKCNYTEETWYLTCADGKWGEQVGECSKDSAGGGSIFPTSDFPYGILIVVAIGVALGVFFGGILLTLASIYMKRRRNESAGNEDRVYDFAEQNKSRMDSMQRYPYGPRPDMPQGGGENILVDPRMKEGVMIEPPYQQYGHIGSDYPHEYRGPHSPNSHIYESPKFGRKST